MPFYSKGTVQTIIDKAGCTYPTSAFDLATLKSIFLDIVDGLSYMHEEKSLRHNDLKTSNFLLTEDLRAVISDFGSVSALINPVRSRREALLIQEQAASKTTPSIRPPELWDCPSNIDINASAGTRYFDTLNLISI